MASFEVGSENASTMAGSVLRDERALERGETNGDERDGRDRERRTRGVRMAGATQKGGKEAVPVTYEMEMTVPCVARHLLLFPTNLILSREYQVIPSLCVLTAAERDRLHDKLLKWQGSEEKERREAREIARNAECRSRVTSLHQHRVPVLNSSVAR